MSLKEEMLKSGVVYDIRKLLMGGIVEPDLNKIRNAIIERCNGYGLNFEQLEEESESQLPPKRTYSQIIEDTQIDGIERGLYLAFETLLKGEKLDTRTLDDMSGNEPYSNGFSQEHRLRCRMEILRALCISLKNSTVGYNSNDIRDLNKFLQEKGVNHNLRITRQQLDYIHNLKLEDLEEFYRSVDLTLLPQTLYDSTNIWNAIDKKGGENDYIYETKGKNEYRIYINLHGKSDKADTFLTDYIKMCISKKLPFSMKGHQGKGENVKDNTVLYVSEENLLEYLQILDNLSLLHPDIVNSFGEPPLLTQKLSSRSRDIQSGWFGFADLGQDGQGTYNDRTRKSCLVAFMATLYSVLPYKEKEKIAQNGFSIKDLARITKFNLDYSEIKLSNGRTKRKAVFLNENTDVEKDLRSPIKDIQGGGVTKSNSVESIVKDLTALCTNKLKEISKSSKRKNEMFEEFKRYYTLMENYFKYNSPRNKDSVRYSFDDFKNLPTTVSMSLYEKYRQELSNRQGQQNGQNDMSFKEVFLEAFKDARINETDTNSAYELLKKTRSEREQPSNEVKKEGTNR